MGEVGGGGAGQGLGEGVAGHGSLLVVGFDDLQQLASQSLVLETESKG